MRYKLNIIFFILVCFNYKVLNECDCIIIYKGLVKCDSLFGKGWYRFVGDVGIQMLIKCVFKFQCGIYVLGWLSGVYFIVGEGVV